MLVGVDDTTTNSWMFDQGGGGLSMVLRAKCAPRLRLARTIGKIARAGNLRLLAFSGVGVGAFIC